tara:strand:- start:4293 stop:4673 length:381 start_codon:yes stop_codon:yes gene_type:complete
MRKLLFFFIVIFSCQTENKSFELLSYIDFKNKIELSDVRLIDVRTPMEFSQGNINGSINVDFNNEEEFLNYFNELDKTEPVFLYCRSGNRSRKSADKLINLGFSKIYDLEGGFIEWNFNELKNFKP